MRNRCLFLFLVCSLLSNAQQFKVAAVIKNTPDKGFKRIPVSADLESFLQEGCVDLRLFDSKGKEVPFYLDEPDIKGYDSLYAQNLEIISRKSIPGKLTELIISNPSRKPLRSFSLLIKNAEVNKQLKLEGSSDQKNWYGVKEHIGLNGINGSHKTEEEISLSFPYSDYAFYRLTLSDSLSSPVNVIRVYYYRQTHTGLTPIQLPAIKLSVSETADKQSVWRVDMGKNYRLDGFRLAIGSPAFYQRNAVVATIDTVIRKGRKEILRQEYQRLVLSSNLTGVYPLRIKQPVFYLIVENQDNPPLEINGFTGYSSQLSVISYLDQVGYYTLQGGNDSLLSPNYDIAHFRQNSHDSLPVLNHEGVEMIEIPLKPDEASSFFSNKIFIWICLGGVALMLLFVSAKMLKELKK